MEVPDVTTPHHPVRLDFTGLSRIFNITYHSMPSQPFVTKKPNSISGTSCLRDLVLTVPPAVSLGETVTLNCSYHLQGENLYAIKLYKGRNEFMTYAAERQPPLRSFPLKGIHIGVRKVIFLLFMYNCQ